MRRLVPFLLVAAACFGDDPSPPPAAPTPGPATGPEPAPVATAAERLQSARDALLAGDAAKALSAAEALLGEAPDDPAVARFLLVAAVAAGDARGAADRLGPDPRGAQASAHHLLRAELLLAAGDPPAADAAARLALADAPNDAAALLALARRAGAPAPEGVVPTDPVEALARLVSAADARAAAPVAAGAAGVAGWRAALARGEAWVRLGDRAKALAEFDSAAADADPRAVIGANLGRARLAGAEPAPKKGGAKAVGPTLGEAGSWALVAEEAAIAEGDLAQAVAAFELARSAFVAADRPADALVAVRALHDKLVAVGATAEAARLALPRAELAWHAGSWKEAATTAAAGREAAGADAASFAWIEARSLAALGRVTGLDPALPSLSEPQAAAVKALAAIVSGTDLRAPLPVSGLADADAAELLLVAALRGGPDAAAHAKAATAAADRSGRRGLRVLARLTASEVAHGAGERAWRAPLTELSGLASGGLAVELAVRQAVTGGGGTLSGAEGLEGLWAGVLSATAVPASGAVGAALSAIADGRQALAGADAGKAAAAFATGIAALPLHRRGLASAGTALDGSGGAIFDADLARLAALPIGDEVLGAAAALHEGVHRLRGWRGGVAVGRDPFAGLAEADREAIADAAARARGAMQGYWLGGAPFPSAAFEALDQAEKAAAANSPAARGGGPTPSIAGLRSNLPNAAVISHIATDSEVHGLVITASGGAVRGLGPVGRVRDLAGRHAAALLAASRSPERAPHAAGDSLRDLLLEPFVLELTGIARFVSVADTQLLPFPLTTFPEQASGLRFLADIRIVSMQPTLSRAAANVAAKPPEGGYKPEFFAASSPVEAAPAAGTPSDAELMQKHKAGGSDVPADLSGAVKAFPNEFREVAVGAAATSELLRGRLVSSRLIHLSGLPVTADGGFRAADGDVSLNAIRALPVAAETVIITAPAPVAVQVERARAFLDAGAGAVIVAAWPLEPGDLTPIFEGFYGAVNRDHGAVRALSDGRQSLVADALSGNEVDDPSIWGSFLVFANP